MPDDDFEVLTGLRQVSVFIWRASDDNTEMIAGYALRFGEATLMFEVDPETDEVLVQCSVNPVLAAPQNVLTRDVSAAEDWESLIGADCYWWWKLTNQKGYLDGVQVEFHVGDVDIVRQWMAGASALTSATLAFD